MKKTICTIVCTLLTGSVFAQTRPATPSPAPAASAENALPSEAARQNAAAAVEQELAQESARRGLDERLDVQRALIQARQQILLQALQAEVTRAVKAPSDADVKTHFDKNKDEIKLKEAVRAEVYVLDGSVPASVEIARTAVANQKIEAAELQKTRFRMVAKADDMWVAKDNFPEEIWNEIKTLPAGKVRFFKDGDNFLLLRYEEHRPERAATLEESKEEIRRALMAEKQQKAWVDYVEATRKRIGVGE